MKMLQVSFISLCDDDDDTGFDILSTLVCLYYDQTTMFNVLSVQVKMCLAI